MGDKTYVSFFTFLLISVFFNFNFFFQENVFWENTLSQGIRFSGWIFSFFLELEGKWLAARTDAITWDVPHSQTEGRPRQEHKERPDLASKSPILLVLPAQTEYLKLYFQLLLHILYLSTSALPSALPSLSLKWIFCSDKTTSSYRRLQDKCKIFGRLANNRVDERWIYFLFDWRKICSSPADGCIKI